MLSAAIQVTTISINQTALADDDNISTSRFCCDSVISDLVNSLDNFVYQRRNRLIIRI